MKANALTFVLIISVGAVRMAIAQDVQGMGAGATGNSAAIAQNTNSQERLRGEVATVDEASGTIGIKLSGTVGSGASTAPTTFKVQDGLVFNAVKPGDKVSFSAERVNGAMTITALTKE